MVPSYKKIISLFADDTHLVRKMLDRGTPTEFTSFSSSHHLSFSFTCKTFVVLSFPVCLVLLLAGKE